MLKRPDGKSLKILVRGDCTSRRSIKLNGDLFESPPRLVQNEKAPFVLFLDALKGITITKEELEAECDVASMSATLQHFYLGQAARSVLTEKDADLLMLDSYADMNFELWENERGAKFWVHPAHLKNRDEFHARHKSLGRRSLEQSVDDAVALIEAVRRNNPDIPVLFLNQQTDFYPKLDSRLEYYDLGRRVAERVPGAFFGGIEDKDALELADVGSCGPGKTLHFQGSTYRRMLERAFDAGLDVALGQAPTSGSLAKAATENGDVDDAAEDLPQVRGEVLVSFAAHSPTCVDACFAAVDKAFGTYANYFSFDADSGAGSSSDAPRFTPMLIPFDELKDFDAWEASVKKFGKGARIRQKKKAIAAGCYVKPFPWRLFIPDIHEANTSKEIRSGGKIRQNLKSSIESLGGYPTKRYEVSYPECHLHWRMTFGVFVAKPGHMQGKFEVGEKLVGYISLRRTGDLVLYAQILGHGDYLNHGALTLLHHEVVKWISENADTYTRDLRFVMYGGLQNGGSDLLRFKRQAGFAPYLVHATRQNRSPDLG